MFWWIIGVVMVFIGIGLLIYWDIQSGECEDDYYNDVPPAGMGGTA